MFRRLSIALLAATVSVPLSTAQMRVGMGRPASGAHAAFARGRWGGIGLRHEARPFTRGAFLGLPFFYSDLDGSEPYVVENSVEGAPPQVVVVQSAVSDDSSRKNRPQPLLIEWQGDRYVRFGGAEATGEYATSARPDYAQPMMAKLPAKPPISSPQEGELPPAVLVYRDGHREEIPDYAIADGVIYVRGKDWQNGYWTKRIPLSALDPEATVQANQQHGVTFLLPSAPNVVIASF